jgi:hypothetical protein
MTIGEGIFYSVLAVCGLIAVKAWFNFMRKL